MTTDRTPVRRPRLWLLIGAVLTALSIAVLWPLQSVGQICVKIYPAPPGCGAAEPRWVPLVAIGLIIAVFAAMVIVALTTNRPQPALAILVGAIVLIALLAAGIVGLSQTGIWDPYQPPIIVN